MEYDTILFNFTSLKVLTYLCHSTFLCRCVLQTYTRAKFHCKSGPNWHFSNIDMIKKPISFEYFCHQNNMKSLYNFSSFLSTLACCQRVNSSFAKHGGPADQTLSWESKGVCIGISTAASLSASQLLRYEWRPFLQIHNPAGLLIWGYSFLQPYTSRFGLASVGVLAIYYAWAYEWAGKKVRCVVV